MAPRRKRDVFKGWLSSVFTSKDGIRSIPDGVQRPAESAGFFGHAQGVAVNNSPMTAVQGNQYSMTYVQGDRNIVPQIMGLLSQHIIHGAAHDDSARTPPPRCHPNTRVKILDRLTAWFEGQAQEELLLWITGPAGVGKSAIVQTFAEYLAKSKSLGASVFISRPNKRNNPHGIFITIAFQLATRIEAYRNYIVERLSLDPSLVNKDMQAQFSTFIVEPFVEKQIGVDGKRWVVLLDGLDELKGDDAQCTIIQLIGTFAREHPDIPLLWVIASRPEARISNTFDDDEVRHIHWSEYIPIDSTEACADVERFLRSSFKTIQKNFRQSISSDWPSDSDFLKLTVAASGLFVYAEVVMQFIRDPNQADPVARFKVLLSIIDRSAAVPTSDNPFVHLDALYHEILSAIPLTLWLTAKQLLSFTIYGLPFYPSGQPQAHFQTLRGMSVLFGLSRHTVYASLIKCRSTLRIPDWKAAHKEKLTILHASFSDYLQHPDRSGNFHIGDENSVKEDVQLNLLRIWNECSGHDIGTAAVEYTWHQYCPRLDDGTPSKTVTKFHSTLFRDFVDCMEITMCDSLSSSGESIAYMQLQNVHMVKLCYHFGPKDLEHFVLNLRQLGKDSQLLRAAKLSDLKFEHLDWKEMSPAKAYEGRKGMMFKQGIIILHRPSSSADLKAFLSELELLKEYSPELEVVIVGGVYQGRVAAFEGRPKGQPVYYVIPYHE